MKLFKIILGASLVFASCEKNNNDTEVNADLSEHNSTSKLLALSERGEQGEFLVTDRQNVFVVRDCNLDQSNIKYQLFEKITPKPIQEGKPFTLQIDGTKVFQNIGRLRGIRYTYFVDGEEIRKSFKWADLKNSSEDESLSAYRRAILRLTPGEHTIKIAVKTLDKRKTDALECFFNGDNATVLEDSIQVYVPSNEVADVEEEEASTEEEATTTETTEEENENTTPVKTPRAEVTPEIAVVSSELSCEVKFRHAISRKRGDTVSLAFQVDVRTVGTENISIEYFMDGKPMIHNNRTDFVVRSLSFKVNSNTGEISGNPFRETLSSLSAGTHVFTAKVSSAACPEGGEASASFDI